MAKLLQINMSRAVCLAFIILGNFQNWNMWSFAGQVNRVCYSKVCYNLADEFKKNMNQNGKPCTDFYDYVCKGWAAQNPKPTYEETWGVDQAMEYRVFQNLKTTLENRTMSNIGAFEIAKKLYAACTNLPSVGKLGATAVKNIVLGINNFPLIMRNTKVPEFLSWSAVENNYIKETGESGLLEYNLIAETDKSNNIVMMLRQAYSAYGSLKLYAPWRNIESRKQYKIFLSRLVINVAPFKLVLTDAALDKGIESVLQFRNQISKIIAEVEGDTEYELMTIGEFQEWYINDAKSGESAKINWLEKIRAMYKNSKDADGLPINDLVKIRVQKNYFLKLAALLKATDKSVILNHIHLYFVERHMNLTPELKRQLLSVLNNVQHYVEIWKIPEKWQWCIENHNLGLTIGKIYVNRFFPDETKKAVIHMFDESKDILEMQINASNWLDATTRSKSIAKLHFTTSQIGYPDWYDSKIKATRDSHDIDPLVPTAYFVQEKNTLYASAAYLQPPLYNPNAPYVINYGSAYSLIGHELYHAFGHKGLKHDITGQNNIWWSPNMYNQFLEQSQCFNDQYNQYREKELKKHKKPKPSRADLPSTVDEDISDVMGLKLAFEAFKQKLRKNNNECPILPGFEKSCEKLFFIAFGNAFCSGLTPNDEYYLILSDKHSLPKIRVNGAVANMKEFSEAFGCTSKDPLKAQKTCDIWKK